MKLFSTLTFKERLEKAYIAQIVDTHPEFQYKRVWLKKFDADKEARANDTFERKLNGQIVKYTYNFEEIKDAGIYECFKVSEVNPDWNKKAVLYLDPNMSYKDDNGEIVKGWGDYIQYKNIVGILNAMNNGELIDINNLKLY